MRTKYLDGAHAPTRDVASAPAGEACTNSQRRSQRGRPAQREGDPCLRCGRPGARLPKKRYCADCEAAYRAEATAWQERDGLHRYLHTRDDLPSVGHLAKLREQAKALGINWRAEPPAITTFDARMAILTGRPPAAKPRPKRKPAREVAVA